MTASSHGRGRPGAGFATAARGCAHRSQGQHAPAERLLGEPFGVPLQARQARVALAAGRGAHLFGRIFLGAVPELGGRHGLGVRRAVRHGGRTPPRCPPRRISQSLRAPASRPPDLDRRRLADVLASAGVYLHLSTVIPIVHPPMRHGGGRLAPSASRRSISGAPAPPPRARACVRACVEPKRGRPGGDDGVWVCVCAEAGAGAPVGA